MPITNSRKTSSISNKKVSKKETRSSDLELPVILKKKTSLGNLSEFITHIVNEPEGPRQQSLISEYSQKAAAADILGLPMDEVGHIKLDRLSPYEEEILEKTASTLASCINSLLKHRKHLKDLRGKVLHTKTISPIVPLEYPKKSYNIKYKLRLKYIK